ncbi:MAG: exodeoxyribonuclease III [Anaerolineales bacterium]
MKIISWNVNGLRAVISKGALGAVIEQAPDILCLQEIKVKPEQLSNSQIENFDAFHKYWNSAERPGYSGVVTFTKEAPDVVDYSLGEERFDIEGRSVRMDFGDLVLFNLYVPNGQRDQDRLNYKLDFYSRLLKICDQLHAEGKKIILFGDFNTAHRHIDLKNPKQNKKTSGFLPEERAWIDKYLDHEFMDVYREIHGDTVKYTWWTYRVNARVRNIGWRLDYFLISRDLIARVEKVEIYDQVMGSDHCPIGLELKI